MNMLRFSSASYSGGIGLAGGMVYAVVFDSTRGGVAGAAVETSVGATGAGPAGRSNDGDRSDEERSELDRSVLDRSEVVRSEPPGRSPSGGRRERL
jgi:hypothetical protein